MKYENWLSSKEKWELIVKNIRNRNKYDVWDESFYDVSLNDRCGYCDEFGAIGDCSGCPLDAAELCGNGYDLTYDDVMSSLHCGDIKEALAPAKKILDFIINDEPTA
jgi:hypothetical protein